MKIQVLPSVPQPPRFTVKTIPHGVVFRLRQVDAPTCIKVIIDARVPEYGWIIVDLQTAHRIVIEEHIPIEPLPDATLTYTAP